MALNGLAFEKLQAGLSSMQAGWSAEQNDLTLLNIDELNMWLGYEPGPEDPSLDEQEAVALANFQTFEATMADTAGAVAAYPAVFDLRDVNGRNYITMVKNQGGCGSCVAFGVAATAEGCMRRQRGNTGLNIDFSEAQLFYCHARSEGRRCNNGWWSSKALDAFRDKGVTDEPHYPYTAGDQDCTGLKSGWQGHVRKITGWKRLTKVADMKEYISKKGPLVACYTVYEDFFAYKSGIYRHVQGKAVGGHCISVVGYSDSGRYWICKNSWGGSWGDKGYFKIAYGQCGIDSFMDAINSVETGWDRDTRVTGLWANSANRNAWAHFAGIGWRKISPDNDNIFINMLTQLATAKAGNRRVDFYQEASVIKQIYAL